MEEENRLGRALLGSEEYAAKRIAAEREKREWSTATLAKQMTEASLPEIGRQFGGKHHTTVLHSVEKIEEVRKNDKDLNRLINKLTEQLGG